MKRLLDRDCVMLDGRCDCSRREGQTIPDCKRYRIRRRMKISDRLHVIATGMFGVALIGAMFAHYDALVTIFLILFVMSGCAMVS